MSDRRTQWQPPARPDWVREVNALGGGIDLAGVIPLDAESLIAAASRNTGLSDFGSIDWRRPFETLVQALDQEANLNFMGRVMARSDVLMFLEGRLLVEDAYRRHPEIEEQVVKAPVWIMGQGRTGTSILQKLMAMDPSVRTLKTYEALFPVRRDEDAADTRPMLAEQRMALWRAVTPEIDGVHDFGGDEPMETIMAESMSFQTPAWLNLLGLMPSFNAIVDEDMRRNSLTYLRRVLKLLQWQSGAKDEPTRWVLKSPDALAYLPAVREAFPDVRLIWAHRDPIVAMSSAVSMVGTLIWSRSDVVPSAGFFDFITDPRASAGSLAQAIDWIEHQILPAGGICHVHYASLIADALGEIERIYREVGLPFGSEARSAIAAHQAATQARPRSVHRYAIGEPEEIAADRRCFARYQDYFRVPSEV